MSIGALLAGAFAALFAVAAQAGEQYVDGTGYAASGYDVVAYFDLPQSEVGTPQTPAVDGKATITAAYNGATFAFSTKANRDRFLANPDAFAPQFDGHCAYGVAQGGKVPGNPMLWRIVDGKLYLNITRNVVKLWETDIPGHILKADANWTGIGAKARSSSPIPNFTSTAPEAN